MTVGDKEPIRNR